MTLPDSRRGFLARTLGAGVFAGLYDLGFLSQLAPVSAADAAIDASSVRGSPEIEPLVRLLEDTPEERAMEVVAERIKGRAVISRAADGVATGDHPQHEAASAGVCVSQRAGDQLGSPGRPGGADGVSLAADFLGGRQLPAASAQGQVEKLDARGTKGIAVARAHRRRKQARIAAMDAWDEEAADAAITALARTAGEQEIFELLFRYGVKGFRSIGHKAIYVANSRRTLDCIGWQHAEPVLRSLTSGLLDYKGKNPATYEAPEDQSWRRHRPRARASARRLDDRPHRLRAPQATCWPPAVRARPTKLADKVVDMIGKGISPQSVWDAIFVGAGEVLLRDRAIIGIHAVTTTNALHFAFQTSGDDELRRMILLQAAAFLPQFLAEARSRKESLRRQPRNTGAAGFIRPGGSGRRRSAHGFPSQPHRCVSPRC